MVSVDNLPGVDVVVAELDKAGAVEVYVHTGTVAPFEFSSPTACFAQLHRATVV